MSGENSPGEEKTFVSCSDGPLEVTESKLKGVSLFFRNEVGKVSPQEILRDLSFSTREVALALKIVFNPGSSAAGDFLRQPFFLSSLSFLDKYLFEGEVVVRSLLPGGVEDLQALRQFFAENKNFYSRRVITASTQRIEALLAGEIEKLKKSCSAFEQRLQFLEAKAAESSDSDGLCDCWSSDIHKCRYR